MSTASDDGSVSSSYFNLILWTFLPAIITRFLHARYYSFAYGDRPAQRPVDGSPQFRRHYAVIFSGVVVAYLAYTVLDTYQSLPLSYYAELNLTPQSFTGRDLKTNFKRLSLQAHPDKHAGSDDWFIRLRRAYETLNDPVRRYGYERFGVEQSSCASCRTTQDYLAAGVPSILAYYIGVSAVMGMLALFSRGSYGSYWRWLCMAALFLAEMTLSVQATSALAGALNLLMPALTTREQVALLHQLYISVSIAITQIGPLWDPPQMEDGSLKEQMARTLQLAALLTNKMRGNLVNDITPLLESSSGQPSSSPLELVEQLKDGLTEQYVTQHYREREDYRELVRETAERLAESEQ